jgi:hypothetical protein
VVVEFGKTTSVSLKTRRTDDGTNKCFVDQTTPTTMVGAIQHIRDGTTTNTTFTAEVTSFGLSHTAADHHWFVAPTVTACSQISNVVHGNVRRVVIQHALGPTYRGRDLAVLKVYTKNGKDGKDGKVKAYFDAQCLY